MPKWSNSPPATFVVTPPDAFQDEGFDPVLPFPAPYLNWKLNDLDVNGPFSWQGHITGHLGSESSGLRIRGGDGTAGDVYQIDMDSTTFAISTWTTGTLASPGGSQTFLAAVAAGAWSFSKSSFNSGILAGKDTTSKYLYGYVTSHRPTIEYHLADSSVWWQDPNNSVAITHNTVEGSGANSISCLCSSSGTFLVVVALPFLGGHNTDLASAPVVGSCAITGFSMTLTTDSGQTADVRLHRKPRAGGAAVIISNGGSALTVAASTTTTITGTQPSEVVDLNTNSYYVSILLTGNGTTMIVNDLKITLTKYAVE